MPISKPRSSLRLYVLIRVAAVSEPPLDHSGVTVFRRAYYSIWHEVVHSVGDRYSDYLRSAARSGVPPWVAAAEPTLARQLSATAAGLDRMYSERNYLYQLTACVPAARVCRF